MLVVSENYSYKDWIVDRNIGLMVPADSWTIIVTLLSTKPSPKDGYIFQESPGLKNFLESVPVSGDPAKSAALYQKHQFCCFDCGAVNYGSYCRPGKRRHKDFILVIR